MTAPPTTESAPKRKSFNWRQPPTRLPRQYIDRQGLVTHLAFALLGDRETAMTFLNTYHDGLGAKPLDLAGDSATGYSAVCGEVERLASMLPGERP